jgi:hypothetical protein
MDVVAGIAVAALSGLTMWYHSTMKWLQWTPDRNGIVGVGLALIILVSVFALLVIYFPDFQQRRASAGFGADWECTAQPKGDPICIEKPGR